jgi:hypothetical protein
MISKLQRNLIGIGVAVVVLMGVVPPWAETYQDRSISQVHRPVGYMPLWLPPPSSRSGAAYGVRVDWSRLSLQWLLVGVTTGGLCLVRVDVRPALQWFVANRQIIFAVLWFGAGLWTGVILTGAVTYNHVTGLERQLANRPRWQDAPIVDMPRSKRLVPLDDAPASTLAPNEWDQFPRVNGE